MARYKLNRTRLEDAARVISDELRKFKQGNARKGKDLEQLKILEAITNALAGVTLGLPT